MTDIVGTWRLVSFEIRREDGQVFHPFGKDAIGYCMITEDGCLLTSIMHANRSRFASRDVMGGTIEEKASAFETYVSYGGRYEVQGNIDRGNKLITQVEISLFPNWVGGKQERFFEVEGERFMVSAPPMLIQGVEQRVYSIWERVKQS